MKIKIINCILATLITIMFMMVVGWDYIKLIPVILLFVVLNRIDILNIYEEIQDGKRKNKTF